ncbi:MAG TPA: hypothetical protein DCZ69_10925 [Syntrophobacteraceae bacterium]|nr:hypothetical protein [Syntrophobacteraceae bacterium]
MPARLRVILEVKPRMKWIIPKRRILVGSAEDRHPPLCPVCRERTLPTVGDGTKGCCVVCNLDVKRVVITNRARGETHRWVVYKTAKSDFFELKLPG